MPGSEQKRLRHIIEREDALDWIAKLPEELLPEQVDAILPMLLDPIRRVKIAALRALGKLAGEKLVEHTVVKAIP